MNFLTLLRVTSNLYTFYPVMTLFKRDEFFSFDIGKLSALEMCSNR